MIRCVVNASHLKRVLGNPQLIEFTADDFVAAFRAFDAVVQIASAEQASPSMCGQQIPI